MCKINGKKMMEMRISKGVSRQTLAKRVGVNVNTILNYENGKTKDANPKTVQLIATALETTVNTFEDTSALGSAVINGRRGSIKSRFEADNRYMTPFMTQKYIKDLRNGDENIAETEAKRASVKANQQPYGNKVYTVVLAKAINIPKWQRNTDRVTCTEIAENYDENKYDPIKVYLLNGKMYVADGAHRLIAYLLKGTEYILVELLSCKTDEEAAKTFVEQSLGRKQMSPNDMWRAAIEIGLEQHKTLRKICMECKVQIKVDLYKIDNPVGTMNTVTNAVLKLAQSNPVLLKRILKMIEKLKWNGSEVSPYKKYIIKTFEALYRSYTGNENELENLLMITCKGATYYEEKVCTTLTQCRLYDMISEDLEKTNALLKKVVTE